MVDSQKSRYKKRRSSDDNNNNQSLAFSLIIFIFIVYACGFLSSVLSLPNPPISAKEIFSLQFLSDVQSGGVSLKNDNDSGDSTDADDGEENGDDENIVPKSIWPISITKDKSDWIEISHPGDEDIKITVPGFWSPPIHNNTLMTRPQAMSIGTCATPDPKTGSFQRGDKCPVHDRTIFVAIASYRDWQCRYTVESIFTRAKYPHRIRVGIVDQIVEGDDVCNEAIDSCDEMPHQALCKYIDQVDNYRMEAPLSVGPVFARHIGHRLYRGEYYAMQSDAHVTFTQDWDVDIIEQQEATGDEMTVLTTYLTDIVDSIDEKTGRSRRNTRPIMCNTVSSLILQYLSLLLTLMTFHLHHFSNLRIMRVVLKESI